MIGAAKMQVIETGAPPPAYSVNLTPGDLFVFSSNGASTSPTIFSSVIGGVGPFEYLWTIDNPAITINSPTNNSTSFTASGFNDVVSGIATLTVTDTGDGDAETSKNATVIFEFEPFI